MTALAWGKNSWHIHFEQQSWGYDCVTVTQIEIIFKIAQAGILIIQWKQCYDIQEFNSCEHLSDSVLLFLSC